MPGLDPHDHDMTHDITGVTHDITGVTHDIENQLHTPQSIIERRDRSNEWTDEIETLITRWKDQVEKLSYIHQEAGYIVKTRFYRFAIPSILIPFIMTFVSQLLPQDGNLQRILDGAMFMATSGCSAFLTFFNYGELAEQHFQYSARYNDIVTRIESELARRRKFRIPSDVFLTELKCRIESLNDGSPCMPGHWCWQRDLHPAPIPPRSFFFEKNIH